jgi:hypothetical protein
MPAAQPAESSADQTSENPVRMPPIISLYTGALAAAINLFIPRFHSAIIWSKSKDSFHYFCTNV